MALDARDGDTRIDVGVRDRETFHEMNEASRASIGDRGWLRSDRGQRDDEKFARFVPGTTAAFAPCARAVDGADARRGFVVRLDAGRARIAAIGELATSHAVASFVETAR